MAETQGIPMDELEIEPNGDGDEEETTEEKPTEEEKGKNEVTTTTVQRIIDRVKKI